VADVSRTRWLIVIGLLFFIILIVSVVAGGYLLGWQWTGLAELQVDARPGQFYQPPKTLWDWLDLLIVPAVLAGGALWLSRSQYKQQQAIAADERWERALQYYYDRMSTLLIEHDLRNPESNHEASAVAQALTLASLRAMDKARQVLVVRFLHNARLIDADNPVISLTDTDFTSSEFQYLYLRDAKLSYINFGGGNFRKTNLHGANLSGAVLKRANLSGSTLYQAQLIGTSMDGADLRGADLAESDATGAKFAAADLQGANLTKALLISADFAGANLSGADLSNADLTGANLSGADLRGANFTHAYMFGANLERAIKTNTNFSGAILLNVIE
jgi:uncharacterized protein YjbI with pentapeptide repeats